MPNFFRFQNPVTTASGHLGYVQQLGPVDHVVVGSSDHRHIVGVHLVAQCLFVLPHGGGDSRSHTRRLILAHGRVVGRVEGVGDRSIIGRVAGGRLASGSQSGARVIYIAIVLWLRLRDQAVQLGLLVHRVVWRRCCG